MKVVGMYLWMRWVVKPMYKYQNRPRKILRHPDKRLLTPCVPVTQFGGKHTLYLEKLAHIMVTSLAAQEWGSRLGLAANQIGLKPKVAIILGRFVINPEWTPSKAPKTLTQEGCYSLGIDTIYKMERDTYGWAKWQDTQGNWHEEKLHGIKAIVFQHELDHLNGRTCHEGGTLYVPPEKVVK